VTPRSRLILHRRQFGRSQREVAEGLGVPPHWIRDTERGPRSRRPSLELFELLRGLEADPILGRTVSVHLPDGTSTRGMVVCHDGAWSHPTQRYDARGELYDRRQPVLVRVVRWEGQTAVSTWIACDVREVSP